ncbi:ShlB/FhaC/HecB family hemolysin secretion/activation protein [Paracoccus lutimaris]|uniref:Hemolysin activation/secretion protein n=1 Tax=Paracoccus lutimaris TaxID=1490030 RepID=A0A368ZCT0_9RHOB|nr:ShlB/FhaC/HecB family hemolysin secretion/activation protein [Paracoccus lutimaris]RCW89007.1 hemolysin activation/secretion protein [Paracoccus lutimaris]
MPDAEANGFNRAAFWRRAAIVSAVTLGLVSPSAQAQTASSVTPESFQPPLRNLSGSVVFTGQTGTQAPPGSEQIGITLSGVSIDGAFPQMAAANSAFEARLTRGRIPVSELFDATADLEASYAKAGFALTRVVLPQQTLRDGGRLRVEVVDGFVETVDTSRVPPEVRRRIESLTGPLVGQKGLTMTELERQLLLAGDVSGVALGSALAAGQRPGGTVIALDPQFRKVTGFIGFDNFAPSDLGSIAPDDLNGLVLNSGFELNSPLGYGETFYGRFSASPERVFSEDPRYRILALGAMVPTGPSGLAFNLEVTSSDTTPDNDDVPTRSDFDRQSLRVIYPWIRSRAMNLTSQFIIDRQRDRQKLRGFDLPIFEDRLTILRAATTLSYNHADGNLSEAGLILSHGVDALGARTADEARGGTPLSRQGADAVFTKLSGSVMHQRAIRERFALGLTGRFQTSFGDPLLTSEQFSIAGPGELSAFDTGALRGDSGWVVRAELSYPHSVAISGMPLMLSPYVFAGAGSVSIERPTVVESSSENAHAYGIGLDLLSQSGSRYRSSSLRIEYGRGERDDGPDNTRFSLSGNFRF